MAKQKGGRKILDKKKGRGHWKLRTAQRAAQLASAKVNNNAGQIVDASSIPDTKTRIYYSMQADKAVARQARNQASRKRRGCCNGYQKYHA